MTLFIRFTIIDMKYIFFYISLYYIIIISLSLFITKRYLKIDNLPIIIVVLLYIIAAIIFVFGIFNDLNIISVNSETMNYLNELDFVVELPETKLNTHIEDKNITDSNIFLRFLDLFNRNNAYCSINTELKNIYYINKHGITYHNKAELIKIHERYLEATAHNKEILLIIDSFTDILNDLELIQKNLMETKR